MPSGSPKDDRKHREKRLHKEADLDVPEYKDQKHSKAWDRPGDRENALGERDPEKLRDRKKDSRDRDRERHKDRHWEPDADKSHGRGRDREKDGDRRARKEELRQTAVRQSLLDRGGKTWAGVCPCEGEGWGLCVCPRCASCEALKVYVCTAVGLEGLRVGLLAHGVTTWHVSQHLSYCTLPLCRVSILMFFMCISNRIVFVLRSSFFCYLILFLHCIIDANSYTIRLSDVPSPPCLFLCLFASPPSLPCCDVWLLPPSVTTPFLMICGAGHLFLTSRFWFQPRFHP